jgi:hypothetical protein
MLAFSGLVRTFRLVTAEVGKMERGVRLRAMHARREEDTDPESLQKFRRSDL